MTDEQINKFCKAVDKELSELTLTDKLRIIEKLGKKWRKQNSIEINEEVAQTRVKMIGKRIKDIDVIPPK